MMSSKHHRSSSLEILLLYLGQPLVLIVVLTRTQVRQSMGAGRSGMPEVRSPAFTRLAWTHMQTLLQFDWQNGRRQWPRCCTPPTPPILHTYLEIRKVENAFDHPSPPDRHYAGCGRFAPPRPAILQEGLHVQYYRLHAYSPIFVDDCMLSTAQREL